MPCATEHCIVMQQQCVRPRTTTALYSSPEIYSLDLLCGTFLTEFLFFLPRFTHCVLLGADLQTRT